MHFFSQHDCFKDRFGIDLEEYSKEELPTNNGELQSIEEIKNHKQTANMYPKYELMYTNDSSALPKRKDLTTNRARFSSEFSLESFASVNGAKRLKAGANNTTMRSVNKVKTTPSVCKRKPMDSNDFQPNVKANLIEVKLSDTAIKKNDHLERYLCCQFYDEIQTRKFKTRGTQTLYRESSAQTLPYLPEVANTQRQLKQLELFKLPTILNGNAPPGLYEVEVLERARKRWAFARALKQNLRQQIDELKTKAKHAENEIVLQAFEWEHWLEREEYIQECQMLRLELLIGMFNKREREMHTASKARIEHSHKLILARRDAHLHKNQMEYDRGIRKLEMRRRRITKSWRKENILTQLGSPSSEFYAPQLRYGVHPARRHFVGSGRKEFTARMDDLEKRAMVVYDRLECPFTKLREWSRPKGRFLEIEQNFCSDENLQKTYETLMILRKQAVKQKIAPKCLIKKSKPTLETNTTTSPPQKLEITIEQPNEIEVTASQSPTNEDELKRLDEEKFRKEVEYMRSRAEYLKQESYQENIESMMQEYEGSTIGWLMRFLTEEMERVQEQRLLQYIAMLAQKERWRREAAEAGLRQKENEMRQIYERIYAEANIASNEICRNYLNNILQTDIKQMAQEQAESEVLDLARLIDADIQGWLDSFYGIQNPMNWHELRLKLKHIIFPDVNEIVREKETRETVNYIIETLFSKIYEAFEPYDISTSITHELIDRLFDLDLYYFSSEANSQCSCHICECNEDGREVRAVLRKVIRRAVPVRRWQTPNERLANEMVNDVIGDVVGQAVARGSIFESVSMNRFCLLPGSPSHFNLLAKTSKRHYINDDTSSETLKEQLVKIMRTDESEISHVESERSEDSFEAQQVTAQEFEWPLSAEQQLDELKSPVSALNIIYKELLSFLGTDEDAESVFGSEVDAATTSRSSQSVASDTCGLRLILDEVFKNITNHEQHSPAGELATKNPEVSLSREQAKLSEQESREKEMDEAVEPELTETMLVESEEQQGDEDKESIQPSEEMLDHEEGEQLPELLLQEREDDQDENLVSNTSAMQLRKSTTDNIDNEQANVEEQPFELCGITSEAKIFQKADITE